MKHTYFLLILLFMFWMPSASQAQTLMADAGPDDTICANLGFQDTIILGGSPAAFGGTPPYSYEWTLMGDSTTSGPGSDMLSDSSVANPEYYLNSILGMYRWAIVEVTDSTGAVATDTAVFTVCSEMPRPLGQQVINATVGDTVVLYAENYFTCPTDSLEWFPKDKIISSPYADSVLVVIDDTSFNYNSYYVEWYNSFGCVYTDGKTPFIYQIYPMGIRENDKPKIAMYPNPSNGLVTIESDSPMNQVKVFDFQGRLVLQRQLNGQRAELNHSLNSGVYLVRVESENGITSSRLVVD